MKNFASVGKALIIQAVGIQANYSEEISNIIDVEKSGCENCPHSFQDNAIACNSCQNKCFVTKKIYHNEKNLFGSKPRLKENALKLLIYFHFLRPDTNGIVKNVSMKDLAKTLHCDLRTITNNLKLLDTYGYIKYTATYNGTRNILLLDYKNYFKSSKEGGKGYVVLNKAFMEKLLSIHNIVTLRIHLRNMVEIDSLNREGGHSVNVLSKSYKKLQHELPSYCKKNVIIKATSDKDDIFLIKHDIHTNQVKFILKDSYIGKKSRKDEMNALVQKTRQFLNLLNDAVLEYGEDDIAIDERFLTIFRSVKEPVFWNIKDKDLYNLAELAEYYSYEQIEDALLIAYEDYLIPQGKIDSLGALIRTIVKKTYEGKVA